MRARNIGLALLSAFAVAMAAPAEAQTAQGNPYGIYTPPGATPPAEAPPAATAPAHPRPATVAPARPSAAPAAPRSDIAAPRTACSGDYIRLCRGVEPGGGRVIACLSEHQSEVSPRCQGALLSLQAGNRAAQQHPAQ